MTPEEKRAYGRGYNRGYSVGSRGKWPEHKPPLPPDEVTARIIAAATALRDAVDSELGKFSEDDALVVKLGPFIDALDEAMAGVSKWLKEVEAQP